MSAQPIHMRAASAFFSLDDLAPSTVHVKCEAFNAAGSIKLTPALAIMESMERAGTLEPGRVLIESSSGNLGVALSAAAATRGYRFICVTDPNASAHSVKIIQAFGGEVVVVRQRDRNGGYLGSRIDLIRSMCEADRNLVWVNQYRNPDNWLSHYNRTAPEILASFPRIDCLFVGAGTTGTLMGCIRYFKDHSPRTRIVAVDSVGSVTFGGEAGPRHIPGLGTSRVPELLDPALVSDIVLVPERDTVRMCRRLTSKGVLVGGSTGTVLAGVERWGSHLKAGDTVVAISPDLGERYLDTIYNDHWVAARFPDVVAPSP